MFSFFKAISVDPKINGKFVCYPALYYLALTLAFFVSLEVINTELPVEGINYLSTHLRRLCDALILAMPVLLMRKRWAVGIWIGVVTVFLLANVWYMRNYAAMMPLSSLMMVENLNGLGPSIIGSMRWVDILIALPSVVFVVFYFATYKYIGARKFMNRISPLVIALCFCECIYIPSYLVKNRPEAGHPFRIFSMEPLRAYRQFGFINSWIYQSTFMFGVSDDDRKEMTETVEELILQNAEIGNLVPNDGRNLILILVESLQSCMLGLEIEGEKVTSNIDSLIATEGSVYFSRVLPQPTHGRSSDAQLIINTGLYPIFDGAASGSYGTNIYPSLACALGTNGYSSANYICDYAEFWNQGTTSEGYGFGKLVDRMRDPSHSQVRSDEDLFAHGLKELQKLPQPFFAQMVTLSGHDPVELDRPSGVRNAKGLSDDVTNILVITQYMDSCIGAFVDDLKRLGLYDKSVIAITGDHDSLPGYKVYEETGCNDISNRFVPFIIINSPLAMNTDVVLGQVDIYPTLLDVMGVGDYYWRGMGYSGARTHPGGAIDKNMKVVGPLSDDDAAKMQKRWHASDLIIRTHAKCLER